MTMKRAVWIAGALLLVTGAVMASNMGFKWVPNMVQADPNLYSISLPYNGTYSTAQQLCADIPGSHGAECIRVAPNGNVSTWFGPAFGSFGTNFAVVAGEGYLVSVDAGPVTNWAVVGSHNPTFVKQFLLADPNLYLTSIPYHTTATNAFQLAGQIGANCGQVVFRAPNGNVSTWFGPAFGSFGTNFTVHIGESYFISVSPAPVSWTPAHY